MDSVAITASVTSASPVAMASPPILVAQVRVVDATCNDIFFSVPFSASYSVQDVIDDTIDRLKNSVLRPLCVDDFDDAEKSIQGKMFLMPQQNMLEPEAKMESILDCGLTAPRPPSPAVHLFFESNFAAYVTSFTRQCNKCATQF